MKVLYTRMRAPALMKIVAALLCTLATPAVSGQTGQLTFSTDADDAGGAALAVDSLEQGLSKYIGRRVSVTGDVESALGPRLFAIDAGDAVEPDRDAIVYVLPPAVAPVGERMLVTVTGVVRTLASIDITREWGWSETRFAGTVDQRDRSVLVAENITTGGLTLQTGRPTDATGGAAIPPFLVEPTLSDVATLARTQDEQLIGRTVRLRNARIRAIAPPGFWISAADEELFVLPGDETHVRPGQRVNISGVVLALPERMKEHLGDYLAAQDESIYVYARQLRVM